MSHAHALTVAGCWVLVLFTVCWSLVGGLLRSKRWGIVYIALGQRVEIARAIGNGRPH